MVRNRTDDDSVTYWFPWKHPMARRWGLEFGVFDQTPQKRACRLGTIRASPLDLLSSTTLPQPKHRLGPSGLAIRLFCTKTRPKCGLGPAGLAFRPLKMRQAPIFRPFDVRLAVSDMLRSCGNDGIHSSCLLLRPPHSSARLLVCFVRQAYTEVERCTDAVHIVKHHTTLESSQVHSIICTYARIQYCPICCLEKWLYQLCKHWHGCMVIDDYTIVSLTLNGA